MVLVACAVNAVGEITGFGFVGAGYLMSGLIGAGCMLALLWKTCEDYRDSAWHPLSAWPVAAAMVWYSMFTGFNYMAAQTNPVLFEAASGLGLDVEARFLPFYASLWFKLGGFGLIAALRLVQYAWEREYRH
ncbi:hypothetical protein HMP09_2355 [Sphingomonas sp. HMP9]|uniref:hypothetical protein n=1 Tax=Sphingomonas sp. HMP9 TaxID=1517554 RepID=UPI001596E951|nr:hypothetical protein [Sphingomonas sp. HMP9]BCA63121.1 hypothetical protein HMP09_2355 [Sphingomonas sp. HMP9]